MWWTQEGERVLQGAEAALFREALGSLWDDIEMCEESDEQYVVGIVPYDNLTFGQKLTMLVDVGEALLDENVPMPELTAVNEATVAAVFAHLVINVELEFDTPDTTWRLSIRETCNEVRQEELPDVQCDQLEEWELWIDSLRDRILWDADYEDDRILDDQPEVRRILSNLMGISDHYHMVVAEDPTPAEIKGLKMRLMAVLRS